MRLLDQPGPPAPERQVGVSCAIETLEVELAAGENLASGLFDAAARAGYRSGAFVLEGVPVRDLAYNLPSLHEGPERAAWFAGPFFGDRAVIEAGRVTIGLSDGAPLFHCHARWRTPDGAVCGGHLLLDRMSLAAPVRVTFHGVSGAVFTVQPDAETNFPLFTPIPVQEQHGPTAARPGLLAKVSPNVDFGTALADLLHRHGYQRAEVLSGVGSFVGGAFTDGTSVPDPITEALVTGGTVTAGRPDAARIDAIATDPQGSVRQGALTPGANAVGITFEVLLAVS